MASSSSSSSLAGGSMFPTRRRNIQGPLHPLHRAPPSMEHQDSMNSSYSRVSQSSSDDFTPSTNNSVFLAPSVSRKRNHIFTSSNYSPAITSSHSASYLETEMDAHSIDSLTSSNSNFRQAGRGPSSHSTFAEPTMSSPLRAPQGEFSFQAQAPPSLSGAYGAATTMENQSGGETSSMAFARLAQAQRAQQEAQRQSASGQTQDEYGDGPASKKRRGMASAIVDGALSAAIYTGAAAVTAYSLWSSWGRKTEEEGEGETRPVEASREKLPPGGLEEPPPPYIDQRDLAASSTPSSSSKTPLSPSRPAHIYVSSRRRRPVFQTHKSMRSNTPKRKTTSDFGIPQLQSGNGTAMAKVEGDDEEMDEDDMFSRMQSKMASMIEEGNRALHAKAELEEEELPPLRPMLTPSKSDPLGWNRGRGEELLASPSSFGHRSTSNRFELGFTPTTSHSQPFIFGLDTPEPSAFTSPRSNQMTLGRSQNSPYSRIPRLGTPSTPSNKRRF